MADKMVIVNLSQTQAKQNGNIENKDYYILNIKKQVYMKNKII